MAKNSHLSARGPSQRQLRVGELIRRSLSDLLMRGDLHDPDLARFPITVGEVRTSPDLKIATAFILPLGGKNAEEALSALRRNRHEIRKTLTKTMALKHSPEIRFQIDETFDQMEETHRLLNLDDVKRDLDTPEGDAE
ncbi:30S ribosome-binding factor RbfA [Cochlodiniinecator piscidefendens]|uniref:30S ribosome-binding factor RbfA n=1 Tax=Cochlodiniinecator piscidefendens TaxID=2715756 RepID=UPI001409919B|nr:30S ribosome-binding factor RbfA [Cochlodiniinecator piscidefendens]